MKRALLLAILAILPACGGGASQPAPTTPAPAPAPTPSAPATALPASSGESPKPDAKPEEKGPKPEDTASLPASVKAAVEASDRDADDKALDAGRKPGTLLQFCGVAEGGKVAEIGAGGGYTAELLARAVGPKGKVYGVNNKWVLERFAEKPWAARLAKPVNKNVTRLDREFDDPFPKDVKGLDVVLINLFFHDTYWLKVDRDRMNKAVMTALKPGGTYCILDHSGRAGTGTSEVQTLHRIEQKVVVDDVQKAGFKLGAESDAWRNPSDTRDWNAAPFAAKEKRGTSDRFALKFVKP
jgi:predicted methyltransferase